MANLKEIAAALAILSAGTLTLSGCKKEETTPPEDVKADTAGAEGGEAAADTEAAADGEASCSAAADGEAACSAAAEAGEEPAADDGAAPE